MKFMVLCSTFSSLLYASSSHPVLLMTFILLQTMIMCLIIWIKLKTSWFSYVLFLIFLGGLMVLFIYITSLASNEKIIMKIDSLNIITIITISMTFFLLMHSNNQQNFNNMLTSLKTFNLTYSWSLMSLTMITMVYLLLTLVIVVKISNKFEAPIKNKIFN